jgi:hypothetical protein
MERFISNPVRKERFAKHLWPTVTAPKDVDECWVVLEFLAAAESLPDEPPRKLSPPRPDLACVITGQTRLFELGEVLQSELAEGFAYSAKQSERKAEAAARGDEATAASIQTADFRKYKAHEALDRMLRKKLSTAYQTEERPADLIMYYDRQFPWAPFWYLRQWADELARLIGASSFQNVWLFSLQDQAVMGRLRLAQGNLHMTFDHRFDFDPTAPFEALIPGAGDQPDEIRSFVPVIVPAARNR